jgi:hypothetical protein
MALVLFWLSAEVGPTRLSHMELSLWTAAGYNSNDTMEFLTSLAWSLNHPNIFLSLRMPGSQEFLNAWSWMTRASSNQSVDFIMAKGARDFATALNNTYVSSKDCSLSRMHVHVQPWVRCPEPCYLRPLAPLLSSLTCSVARLY